MVNGESVEVDGTLDEVHDKLNSSDPWVKLSDQLVIWPAHVTHLEAVSREMHAL